MEIICLTRFNLEIPSFSASGERLCLNEDYLRQRFDLFEKYTLPSIEAQTDGNFTWIVMFHEETPQFFRAKIDQYVNRCPQLQPLYLNAEHGIKYVQIISDLIKEHYPGGKVITVRLDNDDMLCCDFMVKVREMFSRNPEKKIYSAINGLQYETEHKWIIKYTYPSNHFLCMMADTDEKDNNILCFDHSMIDSYFPKEEMVFEDNAIPMWVEIISGTNVVNALSWSLKGLRIPKGTKEKFQALEWPEKIGMSRFIYDCSLILKVALYKMQILLKKIMMKK